MHRDIYHQAHVEVVGFICVLTKYVQVLNVAFAFKLSSVLTISFWQGLFNLFSHFSTKCNMFDSNLLTFDCVSFTKYIKLLCFTYAHLVYQFDQL